ncbi:MAG: hypothetical protein HPY57_15465 [Ignavibacteria bacterium]|nr:hypothetical protein [Ignavibacteria bacterium]
MYEFYDKDGDFILNKSNRYYIGDVLTYEDIEKLNVDGTYNITLSNMKSNNYHKVIKSIYGNIYPYEEGYIVIPSAVYFREQKLKRILNGE